MGMVVGRWRAGTRATRSMSKIILQTTSKPGAMHISLFTPLTDLNKQSVATTTCWDLAELKARSAGGT